MEVLERLFGLLVNKVPAGFAEGLLCFFYFVFRPYRAVLRMVRFARRNNIPSRLLVAVAALLFLLASGFSHPLSAQFSLTDVANGLTQLWSASNKVDALYVILCTFGLTVLVIFVEQCIGLLISIRRRRLFQDFYYVAVGLTMLWWAVVVVPFVYVSLEESFYLNPIPMIFILLFFFISLVAPLLFVIELERRWHRSSRLAPRFLRIPSIYSSILAIIFIVPGYLSYLGSAFYSKSMSYSAACFSKDGAMHIAIGAENPSQAIAFIDGFFLSVNVKELFIGHTKYVVHVENKVLFDALKEEIVLKPGEIKRFRLKVFLKTDVKPRGDALTCGISATEPPMQTILFEKRIDVPNREVDIEVLH